MLLAMSSNSFFLVLVLTGSPWVMESNSWYPFAFRPIGIFIVFPRTLARCQWSFISKTYSVVRSYDTTENGPDTKIKFGQCFWGAPLEGLKKLAAFSETLTDPWAVVGWLKSLFRVNFEDCRILSLVLHAHLTF